MIKAKRKRLHLKGWKIGSAREFLGLNVQEHAYIELRLRSAALKFSNVPNATE